VKVRQWLRAVPLDPVDRLAVDHLLAQWELWDGQLAAADACIADRFHANGQARLLATMPGVSMFIALAIACRIAPIERFPRGRSLANFLGLTPGCRSSGETERVGSITKVGSRMVRYLLAQAVLHLLRRDGGVRAWYLRIKRRRGGKVARVAVMRRTATIMWRMLRTGQPWRPGKEDQARPSPADAPQPPHLPTDRQHAPPAPLAGACEPGGVSTGSSSLFAGEEVAPCPA